MRWLIVIALVACGNAKVELDPVNTADAAAFAARWVAATATSCDPVKVAALIDNDAFEARVAKHLSSLKGELVAHQLGGEAAARIVCAWQAQAASYRLLRVRTLDGEPRPLLRRLVKSERTGVVAVAYEDLELGARRSDHVARVVDVYSYVTGQWLSELLGANAAALVAGSTSDAVDSSSKVQQAVALSKAGKPTEALALVDQLPPEVRRTRETQLMRVRFGEAISNAAHLQALDELAATFPDDPSIAMMEVDGAFLRSDWDAALHYIDVLDTAVGGDPFQNAIRAEAYLARKHPGDLELARARADAATKAEPTLAKGWFATLDVAIAQARWADALAAMDVLAKQFGSTWNDAKLRSTTAFAGLVATPEYAAWLARRP